MKISHQLTIFLLLNIAAVCCQIKFVFEFMRNGATSPKRLNSKNIDMFGEKWLKPKQLTVTGMRTQYMLGQKLRKHYVTRLDFLPPNFDADLFKLFSLDEDGWLLTAYVQMMGLYPGGGASLTPSELKNSQGNYDLYNAEKVYKGLHLSALPNKAEVFPIISFPPENNYFGLTNPKTCSGVIPYETENIKKPAVQNILKKFTDKYYNPLQASFNLTQGYFMNFTNTKRFCSQFLAGHYDKREMKILKKSNTTYLVDLEEISHDCHHFGHIEVYKARLGDKSKNVVRIASTNLIKHLISYMDDIVQAEHNDKVVPRFVMYNGDKFDVGSFLEYLKISLGTRTYFPRYSSSLLIEMMKNRTVPSNMTKEEDFTVNIYFNEMTLTSVSYATLKRKLLRHIVNSDAIEDFCGFKEDNTLVFKLAAMCLLAAAVAIGVWIFIMYKKMKQNDAINKPDEESGEADDSMKRKLVTAEEAK